MQRKYFRLLPCNNRTRARVRGRLGGSEEENRLRFMVQLHGYLSMWRAGGRLVYAFTWKVGLDNLILFHLPLLKKNSGHGCVCTVVADAQRWGGVLRAPMYFPPSSILSI